MQAIVKEVITDPGEEVGVSGRCERHTAREREFWCSSRKKSKDSKENIFCFVRTGVRVCVPRCPIIHH